MRYYPAGETILVPIKFKLDGDYVVPEPGSVRYTLRGNAGEIIPGLEDVPVTTDQVTNIIHLEIDSQHTDIGTSRLQVRTIIVRFRARGQLHTIRLPIRLVPFINMAVTEEDVRACYGLTSVELPDEDIDLYRSYFTLENTYGQEQIKEALHSGDIRSVAMNNAIVLQAAIDLLPSLQLRAVQEEQGGEVRFSRFSKINFEDVARHLRTSLAAQVGVALSLNDVPPLFLTTTTHSDPITGE